MDPKPKRKNPVQEIAESSQHKLLLKQWMKEEEAIYRRIAHRESQLDTVRKQGAQLCILYFLYHAVVLMLLYGTVGNNIEGCRKAWIPYLQSVAASVAMILGIWYKMGVENKAERLVEREKKDAKLLGKCVEELKKKGKSFDLLEEVESLRRANGMWGGSDSGGRGGMSGRGLVTMFFIVVEGFVLVLIRLVLCEKGI